MVEELRLIQQRGSVIYHHEAREGIEAIQTLIHLDIRLPKTIFEESVIKHYLFCPVCFMEF